MMRFVKRRKPPDSLGVMSEHLKYGWSKLLTFLTKLTNQIFDKGLIPGKFRTGTVTPVFKKKGKAFHDPNNYPKIAVASINGKLVEKLHLHSVTDKIASGQSKLQRGFTTGVSSSRVALIVPELRAEARDN